MERLRDQTHIWFLWSLTPMGFFRSFLGIPFLFDDFGFCMLTLTVFSKSICWEANWILCCNLTLLLLLDLVSIWSSTCDFIQSIMHVSAFRHCTKVYHICESLTRIVVSQLSWNTNQISIVHCYPCVRSTDTSLPSLHYIPLQKWCNFIAEQNYDHMPTTYSTKLEQVASVSNLTSLSLWNEMRWKMFSSFDAHNTCPPIPRTLSPNIP